MKGQLRGIMRRRSIKMGHIGFCCSGDHQLFRRGPAIRRMHKRKTAGKFERQLAVREYTRKLPELHRRLLAIRRSVRRMHKLDVRGSLESVRHIDDILREAES